MTAGSPRVLYGQYVQLQAGSDSICSLRLSLDSQLGSPSVSACADSV